MIRKSQPVLIFLAEGPGFEPGLTGPEPVVLPLDDPSVNLIIKFTDAALLQSISVEIAIPLYCLYNWSDTKKMDVKSSKNPL